jgi:hypothetical protein
VSREQWKKYGWMLASILAGNALYFSLYRHLPRSLQHDPFRFDPGLLLDFLLCFLLWRLTVMVRKSTD